MITATFYDRRKHNLEIDFKNRRVIHRRKTEKQFLKEQRRLASRTRRHNRESFKIPVQLQLEGKTVTGYTHDVAPEGLLVFVDQVLEVGIPLALQFSFSDGSCHLNISGQVVFCNWVEKAPSPRNAVGIKFSGIREFEQKIISSAAQDHEQQGPLKGSTFLSILISKDTVAQEGAQLSSKALEDQLAQETDKAQKDNLNFGNQLSGKGENLRRRFSPNPSWVTEMDQHLEPYRQAIWECKLVQKTSKGELSLKQVKAWNIQFYPYIEGFPLYMALNLAKAPDQRSRSFLIDNLRVEKKHADQWIDMALGFGLSKEELFSTPVLPEIDTLTHWMWSINSRGSFAEGLSATNYSIEGVTQGIAKRMVLGFEKYHGKDGVFLNKKAYRWMESHTKYDDLHPLEALEGIKKHATTKELQKKVRFAAQRSMEYLHKALEACYTEYA